MTSEDNDLFQVGLFNLATGLVNSVDGSADPMPDDGERVSAYLQRRLLEWREPSRRRDRLAWLYVDECIREYEARLRAQREMLAAVEVTRG